MRILAIDTSCDETAAAVVRDTEVYSNIVWSQSSLHARFGGVMPSLAQRQHRERIGWVVESALGSKHKNLRDIDAIAVTTGPGLSIALEVGIEKAKELAIKHSLPLIPVNHIEAHLLSPLAKPIRSKSKTYKDIFPAFGLVLSGGTTLFCIIKDIGEYKILAETSDDALGEALDKAARLLGFGYPGAAILEKFAKKGRVNVYKLPLPLIGDKEKDRFSYSGLKTAFVRLYESVKNPSVQDIEDMAASFQNSAFAHIEKVVEYQVKNLEPLKIKHFLFGGGVANNVEIRKRLRKVCKKYGLEFHVPYSKKLMSDNAAMIGVCAYIKLKSKNIRLKDCLDSEKVDRNPRLRV